jgi:hypothetical protein
MANNKDDEIGGLAHYDLDDDFPDYANEQNKELNQIVRQLNFDQSKSNFIIGERKG